MSDIPFDVLRGGATSVADYLAHHVITCLVPAFFIAGAIAAFVRRDAVLRYFGRDVRRRVSYPVAAVSGAVLAVCSCTVLPLFEGLHRKGSGIGPATTFLFAGPAINVLAIIYTARVLGWGLGLARAVAAISMSVVVGLVMAALFEGKGHTDRGGPRASDGGRTRRSGGDRPAVRTGESGESLMDGERSGGVTLAFFALLVAILVVGASGLDLVLRLTVVYLLTVAVAVILVYRFTRDEVTGWGLDTWDLTLKILPVLVAGTFVVGAVAAVLPPETFRPYLGGNSPSANLAAALLGAILYMPTLLEVPIIGTTFGYSDGVMGAGPALSLLLAGPAVSLPNIIVLVRLMGTRRTGAYVALVVAMSTTAGLVYGTIAGGM